MPFKGTFKEDLKGALKRHLKNRIDKSDSSATRPTQALGAYCLVCEKGALSTLSFVRIIKFRFGSK